MMKIMTERRVYTIYSNTGGGQVDLTEGELNSLKEELKLRISVDWRVLAAAGKKIDAIRELRQLQGLGLKEAKDTVETFVEHVMSAELSRMCLEVARTGRDKCAVIWPSPNSIRPPVDLHKVDPLPPIDPLY